MDPTRIPGREPDPGDMSTEPGPATPHAPADRGLPDAEADVPGPVA